MFFTYISYLRISLKVLYKIQFLKNINSYILLILSHTYIKTKNKEKSFGKKSPRIGSDDILLFRDEICGYSFLDTSQNRT